MGGDDLGSDDEYLAGGAISDDDDAYDALQSISHNQNKPKSVLEASTALDDSNKKRRKRSLENDSNNGNNNNSSQRGNSIDSNKQAKISSSSTSTSSARRNVLLKAGRSIETQPAEQQATFVWTALQHHHQMQSGQQGEEDQTNNNNNEFSPVLQSFHFKTPPNPTSTTTFVSRLQAILPSKKQLKQWKHRQSPMILVLCLSARRAVQILKDVAPIIKTRALKLFAKHITVAQQEQWLQESPHAFAVGTPHRIQILAQKRALQLSHTQLIILDAHCDNKQFTVCTLPDTAPQCMQFLRDFVLPEINKRKQQQQQQKKKDNQIKLAFC